MIRNTDTLQPGIHPDPWAKLAELEGYYCLQWARGCLCECTFCEAGSLPKIQGTARIPQLMGYLRRWTLEKPAKNAPPQVLRLAYQSGTFEMTMFPQQILKVVEVMLGGQYNPYKKQLLIETRSPIPDYFIEAVLHAVNAELLTIRMSINTLKAWRIYETLAPSIHDRLHALAAPEAQKLWKAGVTCELAFDPIIPNDAAENEIREMLELAKQVIGKPLKKILIGVLKIRQSSHLTPGQEFLIKRLKLILDGDFYRPAKQWRNKIYRLVTKVAKELGLETEVIWDHSMMLERTKAKRSK